MASLPSANDPSVRQDSHLSTLFEATPIPDQVEGFECQDREKMAEVWPEGTDKAKEVRFTLSNPAHTNSRQVLDRFLYTKARKSQLQLVSPLSEGVERDAKASRIASYGAGRNLVDGDNSSRLSPYLTSGVISGRMVLNEAKKMGGGKLESGRDTGIGMWVQEVGRFPKHCRRVLMGHISTIGGLERFLYSRKCIVKVEGGS